MSFSCEPIVQKSFDNLEGLITWVDEEETKLLRVPIADLIENGARFLDDEFFGDSSLPLKFNTSALRSFCSLLGLRIDILELVERPLLVTELLNDLISQLRVQERLSKLDCIINKDDRTIIGIVSQSYVSYGNKKFLDDISLLLNGNNARQLQLPPSEKKTAFEFVSGYWINTQTVLRFISKVESGKISGKGGEGDDVSKIGIQFKNSMVGDSAVIIDYFIHRLTCANGMTVPAASSVSKVIHSGKKENFIERLKKSFSEVERTFGRMGNLIRSLMEVQFDPFLLAKAKLTDQIFDIIPGSKSLIIQKDEIGRLSSKDRTEQQELAREASIIAGIPKYFAGEFSSRIFHSRFRDRATIFDFINVFTEYAKTQGSENPEKKIEIEEKSGALADWIAKNKKKFMTT
jgi:hypothetical protein